MRALYVLAAMLCLTVFCYAIQTGWIYYMIITRGQVTLNEPKMPVLITEASLTAFVVGGALFLIIYFLWEAVHDHRR